MATVCKACRCLIDDDPHVCPAAAEVAARGELVAGVAAFLETLDPDDLDELEREAAG